MDRDITRYGTLYNLVELDESIHKVKDLADLFLNAMNDWPTFNQKNIADFVRELKEYFGSPLTVEKIDSKKMKMTISNILVSGSTVLKKNQRWNKSKLSIKDKRKKQILP